MTNTSTWSMVYDLRGSYDFVSWRWFPMLLYYYFGDVCVTNVAYNEVTMTKNKHDMFRGRCGYEKTTLYIPYAFSMKGSHVCM